LEGNQAKGAQPGWFTVFREQLPHPRIAPVRTQAITQVNGPISRVLGDTGPLMKAGGSRRNKEFA